MKDADLERLLKSAAGAADTASAEMPFGFDTRVIALWRSKGNGTVAGLTRFVQRITLLATAVIVLATAAAYFELKQNREPNETNEYALADAAIQDELGQ
jgi:hypothetical protein